LLFGIWFLYSYFVGENSLLSYRQLKENLKKLERERSYWVNRNSILKERISSFEKNRDFYYEKLAREMFLKGRKGEKVIVFVRKR